jgi:hypothetical protein
MVRTSVSDSDPLIPDSDPAYIDQIQIRIRIQGFDDQNWEKFTADKNFSIF